MIESEWIPCKTCGNPTTFLGTKLCNGCWEVQVRLTSYLNNETAIQFVSEALNKVIKAIPAEDRYGREPEKVKPLAQYLDEYIEHEVELGNIESADMYAYDSWRELLEQALDAYESTEQVKIRIERV